MHSNNELVGAFDTPLYNTALDVDNFCWIIFKEDGYFDNHNPKFCRTVKF